MFNRFNRRPFGWNRYSNPDPMLVPYQGPGIGVDLSTGDLDLELGNGLGIDLGTGDLTMEVAPGIDVDLGDI